MILCVEKIISFKNIEHKLVHNDLEKYYLMPFSLTLLPTLLKRLFSLLKIKESNILSKNNTFHYHLRKTSFHVLSETKLYDKKAIFIGLQIFCFISTCKSKT